MLVNALRCCAEGNCIKCSFDKQGNEQTTVEECSSKLASEALGYILYLEEDVKRIQSLL